MYGISLWQPWASLIACGAKPYETRDWAPPARLIGQRIAICAAKKIDNDAIDPNDIMNSSIIELCIASFSACPDNLVAKFGTVLLPIGCVVCTARLDGAFQLGEAYEGAFFPAASVVKRMVSRKMPECFTVRYDDFGDYSPGRWAWLLRDVEICKPPIAVKGRQKFFRLPYHVVTALAMRDT